jgi:hypothetical protein
MSLSGNQSVKQRVFMTYLERAITDGHAKLTGEGKQQKILYVAVNHTERYADPEEQVRAEFWAELIYRYGYEPARIGIEITVPDRTPSDRADLVVFRDDERKKPYTVIECKQDGVTDAEFNQAVEQSCGNQTKHFRQLNGLNGLHGGWHGSNHVSNTRFELRNHPGTWPADRSIQSQAQTHTWAFSRLHFAWKHIHSIGSEKVHRCW